MISSLVTGWKTLTGTLKAAILVIGGFFIGAVLVWLVMTFVYEGLKLPLIGQVIDGRVQAAAKEAKAGLVSATELVAEKTRAASAEAQLERINTMAEKTSAWSAAEDVRAAQDQIKLEADDAVKPKSCADGDRPVWTDDDALWLQQRRSGAH